MSERYKVVKLIEKVENGGYSTLLLNSVLSDMQAESSPYITRAFYGVTERKLTLDYILSKYSDKPLKKLPTFVLCVMRLALYECLYMDNTQSYAAVNEAVEMIKKSPNKPLYGYVNAVLRNAVKYDIKYLENKSPEIKYSVNPEIFDIVSSAIGCENAACFFENSLHKSEVFVMVNTIKSDLDTIISDCGFEKTSVNLVLRAEKFNPEEPHFKNGDYFVIDSSAAAAVALSDVCGEDTVLDLCAAPGGKSFCAAILSGNKNAVTSLDLHPHRVELIKKGAHKLGLNINAFVNDARVYNQDLGCFSLVICDVPCSGLGVIKRKPEIKYKTKEEISSLPEIQLEILSTAVKYLEKDGRILYSTCTLNTDENENTVSAFLQQNKDFYLEKQQYILPSDTGGDGFFAAVIKRK